METSYNLFGYIGEGILVSVVHFFSTYTGLSLGINVVFMQKQRTPLYFAAEYGQTEAVRSLLAHRADMDTQNIVSTALEDETYCMSS